MTATTWQESAAAYAIGALDAAERDAFEALLTRSVAVQQDVAALRDVVAMLAYAAPAAQPPQSLRARILSEVATVRPIAKPAPRGSRRGLVVAPYLALAASLVFSVTLGSRYADERAVTASLAASSDTLRSALASRDAIIDALLAPEVRTFRLSADVNAAAARMYVNRATGQVVLAAFQLPPARDGRVYQLWGIPRGGAPVSLGTFNTTARGDARHVVTAAPGLTIDVGAITEEPAGGSPQPTSTPFLVGAAN